LKFHIVQYFLQNFSVLCLRIVCWTCSIQSKPNQIKHAVKLVTIRKNER
jgi:hypothetical protein